MTKQEAVLIFEKEVNCFCTDPSNCSHKSCFSCDSSVSDYDLHEAMKVAIDILKNGEKDGQKGETSTAKDQTAE